MTASRFLLRCCLLVTLTFVTSHAITIFRNGSHRLRGKAVESPGIVTSSGAITAQLQRLGQQQNEERTRRRLHSDDEDEEALPPPPETNVDERVKAESEGTATVQSESKSVFEATNALAEEKVAEASSEAATTTPAPHKHHHDHKDKHKDHTTKSTTDTAHVEDAPSEGEQQLETTTTQTPPVPTSAEGETAKTKAVDTSAVPTVQEGNYENKNEPETKEQGGDGTQTKQAEEGEDTHDDETTEHTKKPADDDEEKDEIQAMDDDLVTRDDDLFKEELHEEEKEARVFGGFGFLIAIVAMIFTAYQMSENPDGFYASVCRLAITIVSCVMKALLMPFRSLFGSRHHGGHMPISTTEPYRSHAMELT